MTQTDTIDALLVDDIVVDPQSGEILEGIDPNDTDRLMGLARDAQEQMKAWELRYDVLRRVLEKKLSDANLRSLDSDRGKASIRGRITYTANVTWADLWDIAEDYGVTDGEMQEVIRAALKSLDVESLKASWLRLGLDRRALRVLIKESRAGWVQLDPVRKTTTKPGKVQVAAA